MCISYIMDKLKIISTIIRYSPSFCSCFKYKKVFHQKSNNHFSIHSYLIHIIKNTTFKRIDAFSRLKPLKILLILKNNLIVHYKCNEKEKGQT